MSETVGLGMAITLDLEYPEILHDDHQDLPLLISHMNITIDDLSPLQQEILKCQGKLSSNVSIGKRLTMNLYDKSEYTVYYKVLKYYLKLGIKIKHVHSIFKFKEKAYFKDYIESNISKRLATKIEFLIMLYKLLNNSCAGKVMQQEDKYVSVDIALSKQKAIKLLSRPGLKNFYKLNDYASLFTFLRLTKAKRYLFYVGWTVLQIAKMRIYEAWHDGFHREFGQDATLLYEDTDSLIIEIRDDKNEYLDRMKNLQWLFDFSNFPEDHKLYSTINAGKIGVLKYVQPKKCILEFCGTSSKQYSVFRVGHKTKEEEIRLGLPRVQKFDKREEMPRKSKGLPKRIVRALRHQNYVNAVTNTNLLNVNGVRKTYLLKRHKFCTIRSKRHLLSTVLVNKIGLNPMDCKRWLKSCGILTLPHGHYSIRKF